MTVGPIGSEDTAGLLALTDQIRELVDVVRVPDVLLQSLLRSQKRQKFYWLGFGLSLGIDIVLSVIVAIGLVQLNAIQQTQTSTTCNLYGLIIPSISDPQPSQIDTPTKRQQFEAFAHVILTDYSRLGCKS